MKVNFLKRMLCILKFTPTRLVYEFAKKPFFVEELILQLPSTSASEKHIMDRKEKRATIWEDFYCTEAMMNRVDKDKPLSSVYGDAFRCQWLPPQDMRDQSIPFIEYVCMYVYCIHGSYTRYWTSQNFNINNITKS